MGELRDWSFADIVALETHTRDKFKSTEFTPIETVNKWIDVLNECTKELEERIDKAFK